MISFSQNSSADNLIEFAALNWYGFIILVPCHGGFQRIHNIHVGNDAAKHGVVIIQGGKGDSQYEKLTASRIG